MNRDEAIEILGLNDGFSDADLKKAFRVLVKKYHPDTGDNPDPKKFQKVTEAKAFLENKSCNGENAASGNGKGAKGNDQWGASPENDDVCKMCRGTGIVRQKVKVSSGYAIAKVKCKYCNGTGKKRF